MSLISACSKMREKPEIAGCAASECHLNSPLKNYIPMESNAAPVSGKHKAHMKSGSICNDCHGRYVKDKHHKDGIVDGRTGAIDIVLFNNNNIITKWDKPTENCSTISCHGGGTAQVNWYSSGTGCLSCHSGGGYNDPVTTNGDGASGKHKQHVPKVDCEVCHYEYKNEPTHMNGIYGTAEGLNLVKKTPSETFLFDDAQNTCTNIACHRNPASFNWYSATRNCTSCHAPGTSIDPNISGNHLKHVAVKGYECTECHNNYDASATHLNGTVNNPSTTPGMVAFDNTNPSGTYNGGTNTCSTLNNCHGGGSPAWGGGAIACTGCHTPGSGIDPLTTSGTGVAGKHTAHVADKSIACQICHENYNNRPTHGNSLFGKAENDTIMYFGGTYNSKSVTSSFEDSSGTCGTISCHKDTGANWYMDTANCNGCHTAGSAIDPMTTNGSGTSGKHTAHVTLKGINCTVCHSNYTNLATHINDNYSRVEITSLTASGDWPLAGNTVSFAYNDGTNNSDASCGSISCHGGGSGGTSAQWYSSTSGCVTCHTTNAKTMDGSGSIDPTTGSHGKHVSDRGYDCSYCHNNYDGTITHMNGTKDSASGVPGMITFDPQNPSGSYIPGGTPGTGSCSALLCHGGDGAPGPNGSPVWGSITPLTCADCHTAGSGIDPFTTSGTGANGKHTAHNLECQVCHEGYKVKPEHGNGTYGKAETLSLMYFDTDGTFVYAGPFGPNVSSVYTDSNGDCNNISCHGNTGGVNWYSAGTVGCMTCHSALSLQPSSGKHTLHITDATASKITDCDKCHNGYKSNSNHMKGGAMTVPPVTFGGSFNGAVSATWNGGTNECSNVTCHGGTATPVSWVNASAGCIACHAPGSSIYPSTGNHGTHIGQLGNDSCVKCHNNYQGQATHINGAGDDINSAANMISFDSLNSGGSYDGTGKTCNALYCHGSGANNPTWGGAALSCNSCHGNPPVTGSHLVHSVSPYSFSCVKCHNDGNGVGSNHHTLWKVDGVVSAVFDSLADKVPGTAATFNSGTHVCANTYCHGDFSGGNNVSPVWGNAATGACGTCHDNAPLTSNYGSHDKHTDSTEKNYNCSVCHNGVASGVEAGVAVVSYSLHVNFMKDVLFDNAIADRGIAPAASYNTGTKGCASVYCHGDFTGGKTANIPAWGNSASGNCETCHDAISVKPSTGSHAKHTAGTAGNYSYSCSTCHSDSAKHVNGIAGDAAFDANADKGPGTAAIFDTGTHVCANTYCHGDFAGGNNAFPVWGSSATGACGTCHDNAPLKSTYGSHDKHTDAGQKNYSCSVCHNGVAAGNEATGTIISTSLHADFNKTVVFDMAIADRSFGGTAAFAQSTKNCTNVYCHGDYSGGLNRTANWSARTGGACGDCHSLASLNTGSHVKHIANTAGNYSYACTSCHNDTAKHADGTLGDVKFDANADKGPGTVAAFNSGTDVCANTYCHGDFSGGKNASPVWGNAASGACGTCHDNAPLNSTYGVHDRHTDSSQQNYDCSQCHNGIAGGNEAGASITSTILHVNYTKDAVFANTAAVKGTDLTAAFDSGTKSCSSTYCHGDYTGGLNSTPVWDNTASGACGTCHSVTNPGTQAHSKHVAGTAGNYSYTCVRCHNDGSGVGSAHHAVSGWKIDATTGVTFDSQADKAPGTAAVFNSGTKACNNTYCHGDFSGGKNAAPLWTGGAVACNSCHDTAPLKSLYGSHDKHTDAGEKNYNCSVCHNGYSSGNESGAVYTSTATHANFTKDVVFDNALADRSISPTASFNTSTKDCSSVYCHGDFSGGTTGNVPNWSSRTYGACGNCHSITNPGTGSHTRHLAGTAGNYSYACTVCHNDSTKHADGTLDDIKFDANADKAPGALATFNPGTHVCANTYCHGDFTGGKNASPVWGTGATGACGTCHDNAPLNSNYGSHDRHTDAISQNYDCSVCHNGVASGNEATVSIVSTVLHSNYTKDVIYNNAFADRGINIPASFNAATRECLNTYCHGDYAGGLNAVPLWNNLASGACGTCHSSTNPATGAHTKHVGGTGSNYGYGCAKCHNDGSGVGSTHHSISGWLVDGATGIIFDSQADLGPLTTASYNSGTKTCAYTYCHGDFTGGSTANIGDWTKTGAGSGGACGNCHDIAPLKSNYGSHDKHTDATEKNYNCSVCHNGVASGTEASAAVVSTSLHANFLNNVIFDTAITDNGTGSTLSSFNPSTMGCSGTYCHGDFTGGVTTNVPDWDARSGGACGHCHNATAPIIGSHTKHVGGGANYSYACSVCHTTSTHSNGVQGDVSFDSKNPNGTYSAVTKKCTNLYCHGNTTGAGDWTLFDYTGSAKDNDPIWTAAAGGGPGSVACGACHDAAAGTLVTGRHDKHIGSNAGAGKYGYTCHKCHESVITEGGALSTTYHANRSLDVKMDADTNPSASPYITVTNTCANTYCHGNFNGGNASTVADWDLTGAGSGGACGECHSLAPSKSNFGAHDRHTDSTGYNYNCSECHNGEATGREPGIPTLVSIVNHANFAVNVAFSAASSDKPGSLVAGYNTVSFECTNTYCHGDFAGGNSGNLPVWNNTAQATCGSCHNTSPDNASDSGSHNVHTNASSYNYDCSNCHYSIVTGTESSGTFTVLDKTKHVDFQNDVIFDANSSDKSYGANTVAGYSAKVCSNTYCHGDFDGGKRVNAATWGNAGTGACSSCHDNAPLNSTYGTHDKHTNPTGSSGHIYNCSLCHNTVTASTMNEGTAAAFGATRFTEHANGSITVSFTGNSDKAPDTKVNNTASFNGAAHTCANTYCHGDFDDGLNATPNWLTASTGNCGTCHELAPSNAVYGVHDKHTNTAGTVGHNYSCDTCHNGIVANSTVKEGIVWNSATHLNAAARWTTHVNGSINVSFSGIADQAPASKANTGVLWNWNGSNPATKTCSNTYCHGDFDEGLNATPSWQTGSTAACGTCHGTAPANALYGVHDKHTDTNANSGYNYACQLCHNGTVQDATVKEGIASWDNALQLNQTARWGSHLDGIVNVSFSGIADQGTGTGLAVYQWNGSAESTKTCRLTYCHGDFAGDAAHLPTGKWREGNDGLFTTENIPSWITAGRAGATPADCGTCHGTTSGRNALLGIPNTKDVWHSDAKGESHVKHAGNHDPLIADNAANISNKGYNYPCGFCHYAGTNPLGDGPRGIYGMVLSTGSGQGGAYESGQKKPIYSNHANGSREPITFFNSFNPSASTAGTTSQEIQCLNTYCHSDGRSRAAINPDSGGTDPIWGGASKSAMSCTSCHSSGALWYPNSNYHSYEHHAGHLSRSCDHCHDTTVDTSNIDSRNNDYILYSGKRHVDWWSNVAFNSSHITVTGNPGYNVAGNCFISCHGQTHSSIEKPGPWIGRPNTEYIWE